MRNNERIVMFDVDSTLVNNEGLVFLAGRKEGIQEAVDDLTKRAMNGEISNSEAMDEKMRRIAPSRNDMRVLADHYLANIVEDAEQVVGELLKAGVQVGILTGNFYPAVIPLAQKLGIDLKNVYANDLEFNEDGSYKGYVERNSLMQSSGKAEVVKLLRRDYRHITHVGDSKGDADAGADRFIGFGGVAVRDSVLKQANLYIPGRSLAPVLAIELSRRQLRGIADRSLVERAQSGLLVRQGRRR